MKRKIRLSENKLRKLIEGAIRKTINEAESYGWVVESNDAWEAYEFAQQYFGKENLDNEIIQAMGYDELAACLAHIFRMNDFREWDEYKGYDNNEEDDD